MKLALIADLHGNYTATLALEAALRRVRADKIICLGDIVGKGPSSDRTFDWAFAHCDSIIGGNWDYGIGDRHFPRDGFYWKQLGERRLRMLRALPKEEYIACAGNHLRCIHGRPIMDELLGSKTDNKDFEALLSANGIQHNILAYADIHRQLLRTVHGGQIVNCGSVGNPLGIGRVCFATLEFYEDGAYSVGFHNQPYDWQAAIEEAKAQPDLPFLAEYLYEIEHAVYVKRIKNNGDTPL